MRSIAQIQFGWLVVLAASLVAPVSSWAGAHTWRINEIYSNCDGTVQFIELLETCGGSNEVNLSGHNVTSNNPPGSVPLNNIPPNSSANKTILLGTANLPSFGGPNPDYIIPPHFFNLNGVAFQYTPYHSCMIAPGAIPTNGTSSLNRTPACGGAPTAGCPGSVAPNSPRNFAGQTGVVTTTACVDTDGDGYGSPGHVCCPNGTQTDCNNNNNAIHPGATEVCNDTIDNNCNGDTDCDDASCASDPFCLPPVEPCCLPQSFCQLLPQGQCAANGGTVVSHCPLDGRCVPPADDCFVTECGRTFFDFCNEPIPAGFFAPGSAPFTGIIVLGGPNDGLPDTLVRRFDAMLLDGPPETIPIELIQLTLVSCQPITVDPGPTLWGVAVDLSATPVPQGNMEVTKTHPNGGTFSTTFSVLPRFTFTEVGNPTNQLTLDFGIEGRPPTVFSTTGDSHWVHTPSVPIPAPGPCGVYFVPGIEANPMMPLDQCCTETCHDNPGGGHKHCTKTCAACPRGACCVAGTCTVVGGAGMCAGVYKGDGTNCDDSDGDGIADWFENNQCCQPSTPPCSYSSSPNDPDSDGDGIDDGTEASMGCDPCDPTDCAVDCCLGPNCSTVPLAQCSSQGGTVVPVCGGDVDGDGVDAACGDNCPNDPLKTSPGACGCGALETDSDGDGTPDCVDGCPTDPNKTGPGLCGCFVPEVDSDGDGFLDCVEFCPFDPNKNDPGICGCGISDADSDLDTWPNCIDNCPSVANPGQEDVDGDFMGDACDCGDGLVVAGEQCDDGNTLAGDGCGPTCQIELPGYPCLTTADCRLDLADNACNCAQCSAGFCAYSCVKFGNANCDAGQLVNLDDLLCVLGGFSVFVNCVDGDIDPCGGNGIINLDDILKELAAFGGANPCGCNSAGAVPLCGSISP